MVRCNYLIKYWIFNHVLFYYRVAWGRNQGIYPSPAFRDGCKMSNYRSILLSSRPPIPADRIWVSYGKKKVRIHANSARRGWENSGWMNPTRRVSVGREYRVLMCLRVCSILYALLYPLSSVGGFAVHFLRKNQKRCLQLLHKWTTCVSPARSLAEKGRFFFLMQTY